MMARHYRLCLFLSLIIFGLLMPALAQVTTTITPDGSLGTTVSQSGAVHTIDGGTILGRNQFHSFDRFDVGTGDTARFTGPASVENILSRVMGGVASTIDGTLQSDIAGADLYLLNPSGMIFGPNARLDVTGSFHVSTADLIQLQDGGSFSARQSDQSIMTIAEPAAFGFLKENPAGIRIEKSQIEVPSGQTISVVAGDIDVVGGGLEGFLAAPGGQIHLTAVISPGNVLLDSNGPESLGEMLLAVPDGAIRLSDLAFLDVSDDMGGSIRIRGRDIVLDGSDLIANTMGESTRTKGEIRIEATGTVSLLAGSQVQNDSLGPNSSGDITIIANNILIRDGSQVSSNTFGPGTGGSVTVRVSDTLTITGANPVNGSTSSIFAQALGTESDAGSAGELLIEASELILTRRGRISGNTLGPGTGGNITVQASELTLAKGGGIDGSTFGAGDSGSVTVRVSDTLTITGSDLSDGSPSRITVNTSGSEEER